MKSKKTTYLLLILSIIIWGTASWKVYKAFHTETPPLTQPKKKTFVEKDSITLLLNYRDPFSGSYQHTANSPTPQPMQQNIQPKMAPLTQSEPIPPQFLFKGILTVGKNPTAIIQQGNQTFTLKIGDTIDGYKIISINENKVILNKERKKYEVSLQ